MLSVGIDVSKGKSTICIMRPFGEIVSSPFDIGHKETELNELCKMLKRMNDDVKVVMEATGIYHLPILSYLKTEGIFVSVINPYEMKTYRSQGLRKVKTDRQDAITIANYGIDHWLNLRDYVDNEAVYSELKVLSRQYRFHMESRVENVLNLTHLLDYTMPGIKSLLHGWNEASGKDKLSDFVEEYWHYDNITKKSEKQFAKSYLNSQMIAGQILSGQENVTGSDGAISLQGQYACHEMIGRVQKEEIMRPYGKSDGTDR